MTDESSARIERLLDVLERVMVYLSCTGGSPAEQQAFGAAFAELELAGRGVTARARERYELAYAEWAGRRR